MAARWQIQAYQRGRQTYATPTTSELSVARRQIARILRSARHAGLACATVAAGHSWFINMGRDAVEYWALTTRKAYRVRYRCWPPLA